MNAIRVLRDVSVRGESSSLLHTDSLEFQNCLRDTPPTCELNELHQGFLERPIISIDSWVQKYWKVWYQLWKFCITSYLASMCKKRITPKWWWICQLSVSFSDIIDASLAVGISISNKVTVCLFSFNSEGTPLPKNISDRRYQRYILCLQLGLSLKMAVWLCICFA